MKTKTQKLKSLLVLGLLFPLILICNFNYNINYEPKIEDPKTSDTYNGIFIDDTISNNGTSWGNWTWARTQSWCTKGNGTKGNPYVIEDSIFLSAGPSDCLLIQNSIKHFIIENCTFKDIPVADFAGIKLNNITNGLIENNRVYNNSHGIFLYKSNDNNITGNVVHDNINSGIYLRDTCNQNNIINNTANNNKWGIILDYGSSPGPTNNRIINNTANYNSEDGIYNKMCDYNNFTANILNYNKNRGIFIEGGSIFNNIVNNTARWNGIAGISIYNSAADNTLIDNIATENTKYGIEVYNSNSNNVINNTADRNGFAGIYLSWGLCFSNNITGNTANDNIQIGIFLHSSCYNNDIKNNMINKNNLGIGIKETGGGNIISENILTDNGICIFEIGSMGIIIENNTCSGSFKELPIFINGTATGVGAHNWTWVEQQSWFAGGSGAKGDPYIIEYLERDGFLMTSCIEIINSDAYFIIKNCHFYNSGLDGAGIKLYNVSNGILIENNCSFNYNGVYFDRDCNNNIITGNIAVKNDNFGFLFGMNCDFNNIIGNIANNNTNIGILLLDESDNNTISLNSASYNGETGIVLSGGVSDSSYNNTILENTAEDNDYGIRLEGDCHFNVISSNVIENNNFGLTFDSSCSNNSVYNNFFLNNGKHAVDDGIDNYWNSTIIGNYWDNHTAPDANSDGIVDSPYTFIDGLAGSIDYLPIAEDGAPRITIISPSEGQRYGIIAPSFNLQIVDVKVFETWYTLDGGLHNYTFNGTGKIDQTVWDALPEGNVTIRFYVRDIIGNLAFEDVTIIKELPLDLGVLVVIIVASIIGGIAIFGAILATLVKRGKISLAKIKEFSFKKK